MRHQLPTSTADQSPEIRPERLKAGLDRALEELLSARGSEGYWSGELSSSALATATAVIALAAVDAGSPVSNHHFHSQTMAGLDWLARNANTDGGWGDTTECISNISTTTLCWAAFGAVPNAESKYQAACEGAERWLAAKTEACTTTDPSPTRATLVPGIIRAIIARYGADRTFSVPILTACALAGRLGDDKQAWEPVLPLPFELAALPHQFFAALRLPVVSYALPALIAIGQARHFHLPPRNPVVRIVRDLAQRRTLEVLASIQPQSGGFLEATPLTSFVVMSLAGSSHGGHPVAKAGIDFLVKSQRPDGSWPIDTNLATWVTTLAINALSTLPARSSESALPSSGLTDWLLAQQNRTVHPYTHAQPGAWAWTPLPGGVPDADDTAGALLALRNLHPVDPSKKVTTAAAAGVKWLLDLQNRDGGIPTFCRGWGKLPFDRSSPDLTAHALRAWFAWTHDLPVAFQSRIQTAVLRALDYLEKTQTLEGSWIPLWFGNQHAPGDQNPCYGTARVLIALVNTRSRWPQSENMLSRAANWLLQNQHLGAWGAPGGAASSVEETALAVEALAVLRAETTLPLGIDRVLLDGSIRTGTNWLLTRIESGEWKKPTPIGFYFASLWYSEKLYPQIFTVGALARVAALEDLP